MFYFNESDNMSEIWATAVRDVLKYGEQVNSRVGKAYHLPSYTFKLTNPKQSVVYSLARTLSPEYLFAELYWYMSGSNRSEFIGSFASLWNEIANDDGTVNSAYGYLIQHKYGFDQLVHVIKLLRDNIHSRQAVIQFKWPTTVESKDIPCTVALQFMVFHNRVYAHTYMRSNDLWYGMPYDVVYFTALQQIVANELNLELGHYTHTVGDIHLYEKDVIKINSVKHQPILRGPNFEIKSILEMKSMYLLRKQSLVYLYLETLQEARK